MYIYIFYLDVLRANSSSVKIIFKRASDHLFVHREMLSSTVYIFNGNLFPCDRHIRIKTIIYNWLIDLIGGVFANSPGDGGSIPKT